MKNKNKLKKELHPPNVYISPEYLARVDEDILRCYPLLRRSTFLENLLKSYYEGTAGWSKIDKVMSKEEKDKEPRRSYK